MSYKPERVVITGLGSVSGFGVGNSYYWAGLCEGRSAITRLVDIDKGQKIKIGAQVNNYQPSLYFLPDKLAILDRFSQFAILAAKEAVEDASFENIQETMQSACAVIGTGCGGKQTDEETYKKIYQEQRLRVHPLTIPKGMPSAAASMVSISLGIKGPVFSVASACASGAHAISQGYLMVRSGIVDVAIVGGTDAPFTYGLMKAWESLRVVSSDTCRPFSVDRTGMVLGEGAGMLVLESEAHASNRKARIYAELVGCGLSSDAGHITRPDVEGIAVAIKRAIDNARLDLSEVDYINAHGTGTISNDIVETMAIRRVFGKYADTLAISSTKSMHGHALGAASGLEFIATVLSLYNNMIPPTANFTGPGDGCDLDYVPNEAREKHIDVAMSNAFAFGGLNAVLVIKAW